jgi:hypothetical protein
VLGAEDRAGIRWLRRSAGLSISEVARSENCARQTPRHSPIACAARWRCWSGVAGCFLDELHARGDPEFGVDVAEVGLHGPR